MKGKDLRISLLLDFYGEVLTDKQKQVIDLYYNDDLSLAEIAEHAQITRQGVRDSIKRGEATLLKMEDKLKLARRFTDMEKTLESIENSAEHIIEINERFCISKEIGDLAEYIKTTAQSLREES